jgi:hypothetical protein
LNDLGRKRRRGPGNTYAAGVSRIAAIKKSEALHVRLLANDSEIPNDSSTCWKPSTEFWRVAAARARMHAGATDFKEIALLSALCIFALARHIRGTRSVTRNGSALIGRMRAAIYCPQGTNQPHSLP